MDMQSVTSFKVGSTTIERDATGVKISDGTTASVFVAADVARELARAVRCWFPKEKKAE